MLLHLPIDSVYHLPLALIGCKEMRLPEVICRETKRGNSTLRVVSISFLEDPSLDCFIFHRVEVKMVGTLHSSRVVVNI